MKTVIFVGPSLPESEVSRILPDALILPPAEQGDVDFARFQLGADIIGLIDGKHTLCLPPLHKEILGVMKDGCRFIGAASLGALRAVECEDWGAEPVGEVARMYKEGEIEDDSEVCLVHADRDSGYKHLSVPLVTIRSTLKTAPIEDEIKKDILEYASSLYYPDREWQGIFDACDLDDTTIRIIQGSECDVKEADSLHLCYYISKGQFAPTPPPRQIENTDKGFALVFQSSDRKVLSGRKVVRKYQVADTASRYDRMNARNRTLALELCRMLGTLPETLPDKFPLLPDISEDDSGRIWNEEETLNRAGEWIACRASGHDFVKTINNFLMISGRYNEIKERL